ncbi:MAG: hypothetical protein PARBA_03092 [Parabacteroides sp.]
MFTTCEFYGLFVVLIVLYRIEIVKDTLDVFFTKRFNCTL